MIRNLRFQWEQVISAGRSSYATLGLFLLLTATAIGKEVATPVPITVSGRVVSQEDNTGLPGVNVLVKGTLLGTVTDMEGRYTIDAPDDNGVLVFSYVGYTTQEVPIRGRSVIDVTLAPDNVELGEIIIVGYGTSRKRDLTGSVARVTAEDIDAIPVYNVEQALNGRAPGVTVQQNSGAPGGRLEVRIRGGNSMIGSNDPLYVVDGIAMTGPVDYLNPADIESIDILKDASATAIYGTRGANGVVIITTKRGSKGETGKIEVNSFYGIQKEINRYDMLNLDQYIEVANERAKNDGVPQLIDPDTVSSAGTDWQDLIFRAAPVQSHTISFSGGGNSTRYSFSTNFYQQDGLIINTGVKRGTIRFNLDHEVNKRITFGVNVNLGRREINRLDIDNGNLGGRIYTDAMAMPPTLSGPYDNDGKFYQIEQMPEYTWVSLDVRNPLIYGERKDRTLANSVVANTYMDVTLLEGLKFKTIFGLEYNNSINEFFTPIIYAADLGSAGDGYNYRNSFLNENILSYTKSFASSHQVNVIGGFTLQNYMSRFANARVSGISNNATENYDLAAASIVSAPTNGLSEWNLLSWLGRANYAFNDKYLITASVRADGSSRFGKSNQWAVFPSAAVAWRISEESFLNSVDIIDDLKLRVSYGVTGNTALSPYQSLDRLASVRVVQGNKTDEVGYIPSALANQDLQWETTQQLDIGFDLSVLSNKLGFTFDYYKKNTDNLLASVPLPPSVGFTSSLKNIGKIENKGIELAINAVLSDTKFKWNISGQISTNKNKVVELAGDSDIFGSTNGHPFNATINIAREGHPLGVFYGLQEDGLDDNGFVKYKDIDGNGSINALDRVILGNPYPDLTYGLNNTMSYGNFELNFFIQGVQGRDLFWETAGVFLNSFQRGMNQFADLYGNYWTQDNPNPNAKYPKISSQTTQQVSDRYVYDASYLRLKLVRLAYNVPVQNINWLTRAQVYVAGTNLLTLTDYPGLDPEVNTTGTDSNVIGARLRVGIDETAYPTAKMVMVGLNLGF
jgi:TonB-dependent starch-binding outer membrane protein SusC